MKKVIATTLSLLLVSVLLAACSGDITESATASRYRVEAMLAADLDLDSATVYVTLKKNGSKYFGADITLDDMTLDTGQSGYLATFDGEAFPPDSVYVLEITDNDTLVATISIVLPESFNIVSPGYRLFDGGAVPVQWTASVGSSGFILTTQPPPPPDTTVVYYGYGTYVGITNASIPPETFFDGVFKILGRHDIYVAAYIGSPITMPGLPFDMPVENIPVDNLSSTTLKGRFAGMVIAAPDSIFVEN